MYDNLRVLLVCTGDDTYHDHETIGLFLNGMLTASSFETTYTTDFDALTPENLRRYDTVVMYAVQTRAPAERIGALLMAMRGAQLNDRGRPVGFVGLHGVTTSFQDNDGFRNMIGATFVTHPDMGPTYRFIVKDPSHPVMWEINDFDLVDELYLFDIQARFPVLLSCLYEGGERPVAWCRPYGEGRVFYLALGHGTEQLGNENVRRMIGNGVIWTAGE